MIMFYTNLMYLKMSVCGFMGGYVQFSCYLAQ